MLRDAKIQRYNRLTRIGLGITFLYTFLKAGLIAAQVSVPFVTSQNDPILAGLLIAVGGLWVWYSYQYYLSSKQSGSMSELYEQTFSENSEPFEEGKQRAKQHKRKALALVLIAASLVACGIGYFASFLVF